MVSIHLNTSDYTLLRYIKHRNDQCTFGPAHYSEPIPNILVFQMRLLAQEDVTQRLLDILEVENNSVGLLQHLMDEVSLLRNQELLESGRKLVLEIIFTKVDGVILVCLIKIIVHV